MISYVLSNVTLSGATQLEQAGIPNQLQLEVKVGCLHYFKSSRWIMHNLKMAPGEKSSTYIVGPEILSCATKLWGTLHRSCPLLFHSILASLSLE
eukprot:jgi/Botrbrau1/3439/Bobra.139_1s0019.1